MGDGRGAALVMILVGLALAVVAMAARSNISLRELDGPRPAGLTCQGEAEQSGTISCVEPVS